MWSPSNGRNTRRLSAKVLTNDLSFANDLIHLDATTYKNGVTLMPFGEATLRHSIYKIVRPFVVAMYLVTSAGYVHASVLACTWSQVLDL